MIIMVNEEVLREIIAEYNRKWVRFMESAASRECVNLLESILRIDIPDRQMLIMIILRDYTKNPLNRGRKLFELLCDRYDDLFESLDI